GQFIWVLMIIFHKRKAFDDFVYRLIKTGYNCYYRLKSLGNYAYFVADVLYSTYRRIRYYPCF
ncbi:hypothetical protein, partial [Anaerotignum sp.]|uniref:hypothetical protein n=1 Tax=Anaerotignum sp. TaxID=2039241 RepID=UPI00289764F0